MATIKPTANICNASFAGIAFSFFLKYKIVPRVRTVSSSLYHTSSPSFSPMSLPRMAVKPAKKTAMCNCKNAFFIAVKDSLNEGLTL